MKQKVSRMMFNKYVNQIPPFPEYNPTADFNWIRHQSGLHWLELDISIPQETILKEIDAIKQYLVAHRDDYAEHSGWQSFCIHGKSYDATKDNIDDRPYQWTAEAIKNMPETVAYFKTQWPGKQYRRVRVMELAPHGYVSIHSDGGVSRLGPINIAITQPKECRFVFDRQGTVPFEVGKAFCLDVSKMHTVFNDSDEYRYHIIVHQDSNHPKFQELVVKSYHKMYNSTICDRHDS